MFKYFIMLSVLTFMLSGCISLPDNVADELKPPADSKNNHFEPSIKKSTEETL